MGVREAPLGHCRGRGERKQLKARPSAELRRGKPVTGVSAASLFKSPKSPLLGGPNPSLGKTETCMMMSIFSPFYACPFSTLFINSAEFVFM